MSPSRHKAYWRLLQIGISATRAKISIDLKNCPWTTREVTIKNHEDLDSLLEKIAVEVCVTPRLPDLSEQPWWR